MKPTEAVRETTSLPERQRPSLSRSGALALLIRVAGAGGMLLCNFVLAKSLGVAGFGDYAQAITWLQVLCVFGKFGLDNTSLRYVSEYRTRQETDKLSDFLRDSLRISLRISLGLMVGVILLALISRRQFGASLTGCLLIASLMIPLTCVRQIQEASLRAVGRLYDSQIGTAIWPILLASLAACAWRLAPESMSPVVAVSLHLASVTAVSTLVWRFVRRSPLAAITVGSGESDRSQWLLTAGTFVTAELLIALKTRICVGMAGMQLGRDAAGVYAAMERFADVTVLGTQSLGLVIAPQFAALFADGNYAAMRKLMFRGQRLGLALTLPVALGVALCGDYLFVILGSEFQSGKSALLALLISASVAAFAGPSAYVLQMTGHERTMLRITAASAMCNLLLGPLLMALFGVLGLGIAQIATSLVWMLGLRLSLRAHPMWSAAPILTMPVQTIGMKEAA